MLFITEAASQAGQKPGAEACAMQAAAPVESNPLAVTPTVNPEDAANFRLHKAHCFNSASLQSDRQSMWQLLSKKKSTRHLGCSCVYFGIASLQSTTGTGFRSGKAA